jgi:phage terminase Nu1 subunit (DNA packaging protein)
VKRHQSSPAGQGIPKSKPRLKRLLSEGNGKVSDKALARDYLEERNQMLRLKRLRAEMDLAHDRGLLIEKAAMIQQAAFIFVAIRRKLLLIPSKLMHRLSGVSESQKKIYDLSMAEIRVCLHELARLPEVVNAADGEPEEQEEAPKEPPKKVIRRLRRKG